MKREEIPEKCRDCFHMAAWSPINGNDFDFTCRKQPASMVGNPDCDMHEEMGQEGES